MKKLSVFAIFAILSVPALAEQDGALATPNDMLYGNEVVNVQGESMSEVVAKTVLDSTKIETVRDETNPKIKFPRGMQVGLGASPTSGINGFIGYANKDFDSFWWKRLGVRFDFATTSPIKSAINSAIDSALGDGVDLGDGMSINGGALSAKHMGVLVDLYPFGNTWFLGGLRLTGGYMTGQMNLAANLAGGSDADFGFELDGIEYQYSGGNISGKANVDWKYSGPYLGTGFDLGLFWGIKIYMDAGVVFTSKTAQAGLDIPLTGLEVSDGVGGWNSVTGSEVTELEKRKAAALADANAELEDVKFFPMVKLGFMYRF